MVATLAVALGSWTSAAEAQEPRHEVTGTVVDEGGRPVAGVFVAAQAASGSFEDWVTRAPGTFRLRLPDGPHQLWIRSGRFDRCVVSGIENPERRPNAVIRVAGNDIGGLRIVVTASGPPQPVRWVTCEVAPETPTAELTPGEPATAAVEATVWRRVSDPTQLFVSTRPEGGRWRTLNTPLDMSMRSSSGRFDQSNAVLVEVPLGGGITANVEVTVWRRVSDPSQLFVSTRPEGGRWRTLNTPLDMSMRSSSGRFDQSNAIRVEVPLPEVPAPTPGPLRTAIHGAFAEVGYLISFEEGWSRWEQHRYERREPWAVLSARPVGPIGRTLAQYAEAVRDGLEQEVASEWPSYSLFEFTSMEEITVGEQAFYELRYRRQEAPQYCVIDAVERIAVTEGWHGLNAGVRVIGWLCEGDVAAHGAARRATLDTLQVAPAPSDYYTQALLVDGVLIKAAAQVDPAALTAAGEVIRWMLGTAREDIVACLADVGAALAIIPEDEFVTTLPEFAWLAGRADFTGRTYESMALRGLGAVAGQPVSATSEEVLIGDASQRDLNVTVHEFAHGIQNLCLTAQDDEEWERFYEAALEANVYPGTHMMHDVFEFFAVLSSAYLGVTDEVGPRATSRELIRKDFPAVFASLEDIYGTPQPFPE